MSKRQYINEAYLTSYMHSQPLTGDFPTADDLIEMAEEMIDGYVGPQQKWFQLQSSWAGGVYTPPDFEPDTPALKEIRGHITAVIDVSDYMMETYQQRAYQNGFFSMCNMDIIGGTGIGNSYIISSSLYAGQITLINTDGSALSGTPALDTTSVYRIYQLGSFPRIRDVFFDSFHTPTQFYKSIPDKVRQATAAQCEYINAQGINFFTSDAHLLQSEHTGPYSYVRRSTTKANDLLIAPKAKLLLKGIMNRVGRIVV